MSDDAATSAPTKWTENADGTVSATWTVTVTKAELDAKKFDGAQLAVFSVGAGGVTQAAAELITEFFDRLVEAMSHDRHRDQVVSPQR